MPPTLLALLGNLLLQPDAAAAVAAWAAPGIAASTEPRWEAPTSLACAYGSMQAPTAPAVFSPPAAGSHLSRPLAAPPAQAPSPLPAEALELEARPDPRPSAGLVRADFAMTHAGLVAPAGQPVDDTTPASQGPGDATVQGAGTPAPPASVAEPGISSPRDPGPVAPAPSTAAVAPPHAATGAGTQAAAQAQISAGLHSAAFAPELGARICTYAQHGVQHARLDLHPAEMGPVTVQILVEGAAAQVRLWAEQAPTRQALEQAMPSLASQLRDSGLTLTGGGVFEQAHQTPDQGRRDTGAGTGREPRAQAGPLPAVQAPGSRRRGIVDLIA